MTEKELETLFRKKLENRTVEFDPKSWEKMKPMLKDFKASPVWWKTRQAAIVSGIIGVSAAAYFTNQTSESPQATPAANDVVMEQTSPINNNSEAQTLSVTSSDIESANSGANATQSNSSLISKSNENQRSMNRSDNALSASESRNSSLSNNSSLQIASTYSDRNANTADNRQEYLNSSSSLSQSDRFYNTRFYDEVENPSHLVSEVIIMPDMSDYEVEEDKPEEEIVITKPNTQKSRSSMQEFILLAGFNGSMAYDSYAMDNKTPGVSYFFGAEYNYYFSPRYSIKTGLNFASHAKFECLRIASEKTYDFGYTTVTEHVRTKNFQFLEIPLTLGINFSPKTSLHVGGYASMMVNMENEITTVTETPLSLEQVVENKNGYTDAFSRWDAGLKAGVTYRMSNRFLLGVEGTFGLVDQTKNSYFNEDLFDRNIQGRIYVGYKLF